MAKESDSNPKPAQCAVYLKALADPVRLQILQALQAGPMTVSDLVALLDLDKANVSHHLRVLFHANVVTTERDGKFIYYAIKKELSRGCSIDFGCCKFELR